HGGVRRRGSRDRDAEEGSGSAARVRTQARRRRGVRERPVGSTRFLLPPPPFLGRAVQPVPGAASGSGTVRSITLAKYAKLAKVRTRTLSRGDAETQTRLQGRNIYFPSTLRLCVSASLRLYESILLILAWRNSIPSSAALGAARKACVGVLVGARLPLRRSRRASSSGYRAKTARPSRRSLRVSPAPPQSRPHRRRLASA